MPYPGIFLRGQTRRARLPLASLALKNARGGRISAFTDVDITNFTGGNNSGSLSPAPGDLLILLAHGRHYGTSGTSAVISEGAATGWTKFGFTTNGPLEDADGFIGAYKIANGTETTVNLLNATGAAGTVTNRVIYCGLSYRIIGTPSLVLNTPHLSNGDPPAQVIATAAASLPSLAFSLAAWPTAAPDQTFATQTPDTNITEGNTSSPASFVRLKTKLFTANPADISTDVGDNGNGNALFSGYFTVANP